MDHEHEGNNLIHSLNDDQLFANLSISDLEARLAQEPLEPRLELDCTEYCCPRCTWAW